MTRRSLDPPYSTMLIGLLIACSILLGIVGSAGHPVAASSDIIAEPVLTSLGGAMPRLVGWNFKGMTWQLTPQSWETEAVIVSMRGHGVNVMRRHFTSAPLMEAGAATRATYFQRWHTVTDWAAQQGMWIIFDFYGRNIGDEQASDGMRWMWEMPEHAFLEMWRLIAREMQRHGNVLLELGNEPDDFGTPNPAHRAIWLDRCIKAIAVIREEGFQGYIVIPLPESATWAPPALTFRPHVMDADPLDRFMWDFHYYWYHHEYQVGSPEDYTLDAVQGWLDMKGISALRATGDRVLCGEFGVYGQNYDPRDLQWFHNLLTVLHRDGYDMTCETYQPGHHFPQLHGERDSTDWQTLNTQGNMYITTLPLNLSYYEYPPPDQMVLPIDLSYDTDPSPDPEPTPLLPYPRAGANKRSPGGGLGTLDQYSPVHTIRSIRGVA